MEAKAITKYIRISPRKTRLVMDVIRGKNANESLEILEAMNKKAAKITGKVLNSAVANARQKELDVDRLWIKEARVDGGPAYKRYMPRAMGRATIIKKPTSHINIILSDEMKGLKSKVEDVKHVKGEKKKTRLLSKIRKRKSKETEKTKKIEAKNKDKKKSKKSKKEE